MKEDQNEQLKNVREHIRNCFEDIFCFLLPHPGKEVTSSKDFDGRLAGSWSNNAVRSEKIILSIHYLLKMYTQNIWQSP